MNVLMVYGAGGKKEYFIKCADILRQEGFNVSVPNLSGFDSKPFSKSSNYFDQLLSDVWEAVSFDKDGEWTLYGHGFGAALILELASRNFEFPNGNGILPDKLLLHSFTGPNSVKGPISGMLSKGMFRKSKISRSSILKTSFFEPDNIHKDMQESFLKGFEDCSSLDLLSELVNDSWYENRRYKVEDANLNFLMGENEEGASAKYLVRLKGDFPGSNINLVKQWPLYPMIEFPTEFSAYLIREFLLPES